MDDDDKQEGFLSRWSRRKRLPDDTSRNVAEDADAVVAEQPAAAEGEEIDEELAAELDENRRTAEAVDIDSLSYEDDFKIFMKRGVPDALRKKALQKLWRSNPVLANLDGLNDYDDDFADPKQNIYKSVWKIGRGFLSELELQAQQESGRISRAVEPDAEPICEEIADTVQDVDTIGDPADEEVPAGNAADESTESEEAIESPEQPERVPRVSIRKRLEG